VSTRLFGNPKRSDIYNVLNNTWEMTGNTTIGRSGSQLISLGKRVFVLAGLYFK